MSSRNLTNTKPITLNQIVILTDSIIIKTVILAIRMIINLAAVKLIKC